jgi:hypothetical protein
MKRPRINKSTAKRADVFYFLKKCAAEQRTASYKEIGEAVGLWYRVLRFPLYDICIKCQQRGLPELNAIAVNAKTKRPGSGCPALSSNWEDVRDKVFSFNWGSITFDTL